MWKTDAGERALRQICVGGRVHSTWLSQEFYEESKKRGKGKWRDRLGEGDCAGHSGLLGQGEARLRKALGEVGREAEVARLGGDRDVLQVLGSGTEDLCVEPHPLSLQSVSIRILDPVDYFDMHFPHDPERDLVHELVHVHLEFFDRNVQGAVDDFREQAVESLTRALIELDRRK
jgi:hypothetical protein